MRASRIFPFARTSRCAIVASGTRNARATSAVVSPPRSRSVSATCTFGASAGWQQVKIRRSWSSCTTSSSSTALDSSRARSSIAAAWRSSRDASRRKRSTARLRAVVMIHPAGFGGTPLRGHRSSAAVNASCTASSAASMSPQTRTSTDTARPYSSRKTRSISDDATAGTPRLVLRLALEGAHLDRQRADGARVPAPPRERHVEVRRLDDREAAELLLALDERPVGDEHVVSRRAEHGGRARRMQPAGEHPASRRLEFLPDDADLAHHRLEDLGGRRRAVGGLIDADEVELHTAVRGGGWGC